MLHQHKWWRKRTEGKGLRGKRGEEKEQEFSRRHWQITCVLPGSIASPLPAEHSCTHTLRWEGQHTLYSLQIELIWRACAHEPAPHCMVAAFCSLGWNHTFHLQGHTWRLYASIKALQTRTSRWKSSVGQKLMI